MTDGETTVHTAKRRPITFDELHLHHTLRQGIKDMGYETPTPIQEGAIPDAVLGRDLIGTAQTGTGKTAAFLLPILERLLGGPTGRIRALVLTPTRELAIQAQTFLRNLGKHTKLRGMSVYGGVGMEHQMRALRGGAEIIIATPGRLLDHMRRGYVNFRDLQILVLDEADRMLDMGFLPDVRYIMEQLPRKKQVMLFSATMPPQIVRLSRDFMTNPKTIQIGITNAAAEGLTHLALPVRSHLKALLLKEMLTDGKMQSVLVFTRTKQRANRLQHQLGRWGVNATVIHGDRSQNQRIMALEGFREGRYRVLVATDIAARGIDVEKISHVVNFDVPLESEVYIHRVGRTARAQESGTAYTLLSPEEEGDFRSVERQVGHPIRRTLVTGFDYDAPPPPKGDGHSRQVHRYSSGDRGYGRQRYRNDDSRRFSGRNTSGNGRRFPRREYQG